MKGFTLIELIVVISVTAVLSIVGIAAFVTYSQTQALSASAQDVATMLQVAKSRAQSQVKPDSVPCLDGYRVDVYPQGTYTLNAICGVNTYPIANQAKKLPTNISFYISSISSVQFAVLSGVVSGIRDIKINGYGKSKTINIDAIGNIVTR